MNHVEDNLDDGFEADHQNDQEYKQDPKERVDAKHSEENIIAVVEEEDGPQLDEDHAVNPLHSRTWEAWGRVNNENVVSGKRKSLQPSRFLYDGRRVNGHYPDPSM